MKKWRVWLLAAVLCAAAGGAEDNTGGQPPESGSVSRQLVPDTAALKQAEKKWEPTVSEMQNSVKNKKITAETAGDDILAALETAKMPAEQYAILRLAYQFYRDTRAYEKIFSTLGEAEKRFTVDLSDARLQIIGTGLRNASGDDLDVVLGAYLELFADAMENEDFETCTLMQNIVRPFENKLRKLDDYADYEELAKTFKTAAAGIESLKNKEAALQAKPDDPGLNRDYADAAVEFRDDWTAALPAYAKTDDAALAKTAQLELKGKLTAESRLAIADFWWAQSEQKTGALGSAWRAHAVSHYEALQPQLQGGLAARVGQRLALAREAAEKSAGGDTAVIKISKKPYALKLNKDLKLNFIFIPRGSFTMGSPASEIGHRECSDAGYDERLHAVTLSHNFYLSKYEITQEQFQMVMQGAAMAADAPGKTLPVIADMAAAREFCKKLNDAYAAILPKNHVFRLPTDAEWEYACRAGTRTTYNNGKNPASAPGLCPNLNEVAWYVANSGGKPHPVGGKKPNKWGLHDMHGNASELVLGSRPPRPAARAVDPLYDMPPAGTELTRGGSCDTDMVYCRAAAGISVMRVTGYTGFRVALAFDIESKYAKKRGK